MEDRKTTISTSQNEKGEIDGIFFEECLYTGTKNMSRKRSSREKVFISLEEIEKINKLLK